MNSSKELLDEDWSGRRKKIILESEERRLANIREAAIREEKAQNARLQKLIDEEQVLHRITSATCKGCGHRISTHFDARHSGDDSEPRYVGFCRRPREWGGCESKCENFTTEDAEAAEWISETNETWIEWFTKRTQ